MNRQHECILPANRHALQYIKQCTNKAMSCAGGHALKIPLGILVLLQSNVYSKK